MSEVAIGIDLGTTFSCAAVYRKGKGVEYIPDEDGLYLIPSVVYFDPDTGDVFVGKQAIDELPSCVSNGIFDAKRVIGRKFEDEYVAKFLQSEEVPFSIERSKDGQAGFRVTVANETVIKTPEEISAEILKYIKRAANVYLGQEVTEAVVSVPAYFSNAQRKATKKAAELAGLKVTKLITEPTAAAVRHVSDNIIQHASDENKATILVFDFGGGTLDVSVISVTHKNFEVKAVYGDTFLGGRNIDKILFEHFKDKHLKNRTMSDSRKRIFLRRLRDGCVEFKKKLSFRSETRYFIPSSFGDDEEIILSLPRIDFEDFTRDIFDRALEIVKSCLIDLGMLPTEIDEVVLVGGSTRIPKVREMLKAYFGEGKLRKDIHPDHAVAAGASIQAALPKEKELEIYKITEVTPLSLGINVKGDLMITLIPKNSPLPCKARTKRVTSINDQAACSFPIYEGERMNVTYNNLLAEMTVEGLPKKRAGDVTVVVDFELDEDGVLNVTAYEESTGVNNTMVVTMGQFCLSERKIKKSIEEAEKHKAEDATFEKFVRCRNKVGEVCKHVLYDLDKICPNGDRDLVRAHCDEFLSLSDNLQFTEIERLKEEFDKFNDLVSQILKKNLLLELVKELEDFKSSNQSSHVI